MNAVRRVFEHDRFCRIGACDGEGRQIKVGMGLGPLRMLACREPAEKRSQTEALANRDHHELGELLTTRVSIFACLASRRSSSTPGFGESAETSSIFLRWASAQSSLASCG